MAGNSRTGKFLKNASSAALLQIVNMLCGMITPRFMLVAYGSQINGLVSSITQFLSTLAVIEAGLGAVAQQSLYKPLAEKDYAKVSAIVSGARIAYNQVGHIFTGLSVALAFLYPVFAGIEEMSYGIVAALVLVLSINSALSFFVVSKYRVLFQADQKVYVINFAQMLTRIINTLCIVVMATLNAHILLLRIVVTGSIVIQAVIVWAYAKKNYAYVQYYAKPDKSALTQRWDAFYVSLLGSAQKNGAGIILTLLVSLEMVSVYTVYNMVFGALMGILGIFMNGVNASFGNLLQSKDGQKIRAVYAEFENAYYVLITVVYTVAMILITPFVRIYTEGVTDANYLLPGLGVLFALNGFLYNIKTPQGMMVQAAGLFRQTRWQNTIQAAILFIGGMGLGYFFGIYGVIAAAILSNLYRVIDLLLFIPKHVTKDSPKGSICRSLLMITASLLIGCVGNVVILNFTIENYFHWFVAAVIVFVCVAALVGSVDFLFQRKYFIGIVKRLLSMIWRKKDVRA